MGRTETMRPQWTALAYASIRLPEGERSTRHPDTIRDRLRRPTRVVIPSRMPKTLILFADDERRAAAIAEGARSVRFAEVDVLPLDPPPDPTAYDALIVDATAPDAVTLLGTAGGGALTD